MSIERGRAAKAPSPTAPERSPPNACRFVCGAIGDSLEQIVVVLTTSGCERSVWAPVRRASDAGCCGWADLEAMGPAGRPEPPDFELSLNICKLLWWSIYGNIDDGYCIHSLYLVTSYAARQAAAGYEIVSLRKEAMDHVVVYKQTYMRPCAHTCSSVSPREKTKRVSTMTEKKTSL